MEFYRDSPFRESSEFEPSVGFTPLLVINVKGGKEFETYPFRRFLLDVPLEGGHRIYCRVNCHFNCISVK